MASASHSSPPWATRSTSWPPMPAAARTSAQGDTLARLSDLGRQDLTANPEIVGRLIEAVRADLPRGVLSRLVPTREADLRRLAMETPGVTFHAGTSVCDLLRDPARRVAGVVVEDRAGRKELHAPLVVAADGRASRLAQLAGVKPHVHENNRF
ncbi:hypothetical protein B4Q13_18030, partial [Lacticaseibacillus rhamnosus]